MDQESPPEMELKLRTPSIQTLSAVVDKDQEDPKDLIDIPLRRKFFIYKLVKQICYVALMICLGLVANISGPTLRDLKDRVGVNYEEISRAVIGLSGGMLGGCLVGGILHERFPNQRDLILAIDWLLQGVGIALVPWTNQLELVTLLFVLVGICKGIVDTGINTAVINMWGEEASAPMHSLHFGFGIGALVAPQLARPFITPDHENDTSIYNNLVAPSTVTTPLDDQSRIEIPYLIVGVSTVFFSLLLLAIYLWGTPKEYPNQRSTPLSCNMCSPLTCALDGNSTRVVLLLAALLLFFLQIVGTELAFGLFIFSYAVEKENPFSSSDATILNTVYWSTFTGGRGLGVLLSRLISNDTMIIIHISGLLVSSLALAFSEENNTVLWIFTGGVGLFVSVLFPAGMSWANQQIFINSVSVMVILFGSGTGGMIWQYSTGYMFETHGPPSLMYLMLGVSIVLILSYILMRIIVYKMPLRREQNPHESTEKL